MEQINELENAVLKMRNDMLELLKGNIDHEQRIHLLENRWNEILKEDKDEDKQMNEIRKEDKQMNEIRKEDKH